ncbi:MAG: cation transporter [Deltaproteobacteria bacterium]|nr:MAG: cation transporter [Deltaproteobacteria bacterium]
MQAGPAREAALVEARRVLWAVLALNVAVSAAKIVAGTLAASMALMADGWHSALDSVSTLVGLVGVTLAAAPPDREHPYGHGRFEVAAALAISVMLLLTAWGVVTQAVSRLGAGLQPRIGPLAFAVTLASLAVSSGVTWWETRAGKRLGNRVLLADAGHTRSDVYTSLAVLASFAAVRAGYPAADLVVAAVVALVIARAGYQIVRDAFHVLSDRVALDVDDVAALFRQRPELGTIEGVRSRSNGSEVYVDLQVRLPGTMSVDESHAITEKIESVIRGAFPNVVDIVVHVEPEAD